MSASVLRGLIRVSGSVTGHGTRELGRGSAAPFTARPGAAEPRTKALYPHHYSPPDTRHDPRNPLALVATRARL